MGRSIGYCGHCENEVLDDMLRTCMYCENTTCCSPQEWGCKEYVLHMDKSNREEKEGFCIWLTGLSGSGKTTISNELTYRYPGLEDYWIPRVHQLDGDIARQTFSKDLGFDEVSRNQNVIRAASVASYLVKQGDVVISAFMSPYREGREFARSIIPNFFEVYVDCSLEVCIERDPKDLYKLRREGKIEHMVGMDSSYEVSDSPELVVDTSAHDVGYTVIEIMQRLQEKEFLP